MIHQTTQLKHGIDQPIKKPRIPTCKLADTISIRIIYPAHTTLKPRNTEHWSSSTEPIHVKRFQQKSSDVLTYSRLWKKQIYFKNTFLTSTTVGDLKESEDLRLHLEFQADINTKSRYIALIAALCPSEMNTTSSFTTTMPPWSIYSLAQTSKMCWKHNVSLDLFHWRIRKNTQSMSMMQK